MSLAHLGLTVDQERLYRYLLRNPHADLDRARVELTMPDTTQVIGELRTLGLVDRASAALAPAAAVDLLVWRRVEQAQRRLTALSVAWDALAELTEEQRSGRSVKLVEHLTGGPSVTRRMRELMSREPREFVHLKTRAREPARVYDPTPFKRALAAACTAARCSPRTYFRSLNRSPTRGPGMPWVTTPSTRPPSTPPWSSSPAALLAPSTSGPLPTPPSSGRKGLPQPGGEWTLSGPADGQRTVGSVHGNGPAGRRRSEGPV
ncbi:hypothetical protein O3S80_20675 [Streptomyces sp. Lzd4kr]|nr:hypothetical protein [Streptomyces sp. Lzd4kr]